MNLIVKLAQYGLIHGDFNEFNILVKKSGDLVLIDFPQMVSIHHPNAQEYFDRDVQCIRTYFRKRYRYESKVYPKFHLDVNQEFDLDVQVAASGFVKKQQKELEEYMNLVNENESDEDYDSEDDEEDEDEEDDEEEEDSEEEEEEDSEEEQELNNVTEKVEQLEINNDIPLNMNVDDPKPFQKV